MKNVIRALVPKPLRPAFRMPYNYVRHKLFLTKLFGHYAPMIPPLELMHDGRVGFEEFKTNGKNFFATTRSSAISNLTAEDAWRGGSTTPKILFSSRAAIYQRCARLEATHFSVKTAPQFSQQSRWGK